MELPSPTRQRLLPAPRAVRAVAFTLAVVYLGCLLLRLLSPWLGHLPIVDWFASAIHPEAGALVAGRPDVWLLPLLELGAVALLGWRAYSIREYRRIWWLFTVGGLILTLAHFLYRLLIPAALSGDGAVSSVQLGLAVHVAKVVFFGVVFLGLSLLAAQRVGVPTPGVRLDGLIGGCGVLTVGTALLVPDSVVYALKGWAEVTTVLVAIAALAPLALLVGLVVLTGTAPSRAWYRLMVATGLAALAAAFSLLPMALGGDARAAASWLIWPGALQALAWATWDISPPSVRPVARATNSSIVTPIVFTLAAVAVLAVDQVLVQPPLVLGLAFLTVILSIARMALALRAANRLNAHHLIQRERLREARDEAVAAGRARSDFIATLSHEIRTPLNAVIGMSELLMAGPLDVVQREQVEHVRRSGTLILELVNGVLDRATIDADQLTLEHQPLELAEVLGDVVELLQVNADAKGIRLQAELDPACPEWVRGDATRLRQILINLLGNAVKFTDTGEVTVEVCPAARLDAPEAIYFQVADTGTGIPSGQLDRLFQPYSRVRPTGGRLRGGTGLGLSISQALVRRMGGEIVVTSQEGVGSVFGFELVLSPAPVPEAVAHTLSGRRITVLDHQRTRADILADQLRRWGAEVSVGLPGEVEADRETTNPTPDWWTVTADTVVVREDHPDVLAEIGVQLRRHAEQVRPVLMIITASAYAAPVPDLRPTDLVVTANTTGSRLRAGLLAIGPTPETAPESAPAERPLLVLLAEDDPPSRRVCQLMVQQLGHEIDLVSDGAAAVAAAASTAYDLVLLDSRMPKLDGPDAARAIRAGEVPGERVPIIALTGAISAADRESYTAAGMDDVVAKPVSRADLARLLAGIPRRARSDSYEETVI